MQCDGEEPQILPMVNDEELEAGRRGVAGHGEYGCECQFLYNGESGMVVTMIRVTSPPSAQRD